MSIDGHSLNVSDEAVVTWAIGTMISPLEIVAGLHWTLHFAVPGRANSKFLRTITRCIAQLQENMTIVEGTRLSQTANEVSLSLMAITDAAVELREWQRRNVPRKKIVAHNQTIKKCGPLEPPWAEDGEFQDKRKRLSLGFSSYLYALSRLILVLQAMSEVTVSQSLASQLHRASINIQQYQEILRLGYQGTINKYAAQVTH